jgi:hypothetical protein
MEKCGENIHLGKTDRIAVPPYFLSIPSIQAQDSRALC